jgi:hypothetical protein
MKRILLCCWPWLLTLTTVFAQVDTGTITGSVRDNSGAGLASSSVTFVDVATNATAKAQADVSGNYVSPPLRPGNYKVTAAASGFKSETRSTITLRVQDRLRVDFDLTVGSVSENVLVTAEAPPIQTDTSSLGEVIATNQITELPLNGRDYIQLATLTTGVVRTSSGTNGNTGGSSTGGLNSFVANGTRGTLSNFLLDGVDNNSNDNGGVVLRSNVDAIQEFAVTESQRLELRTEFFNLFNHPNFAQPDNFIDDGPGVAGAITAIAIPMRQIQFGLKYRF